MAQGFMFFGGTRKGDTVPSQIVSITNREDKMNKISDERLQELVRLYEKNRDNEHGADVSEIEPYEMAQELLYQREQLRQIEAGEIITDAHDEMIENNIMLEQQNRLLIENSERLAMAVIWMSASDDFSPDGKAFQGWQVIKKDLDKHIALTQHPTTEDG